MRPASATHSDLTYQQYLPLASPSHLPRDARPCRKRLDACISQGWRGPPRLNLHPSQLLASAISATAGFNRLLGRLQSCLFSPSSPVSSHSVSAAAIRISITVSPAPFCIYIQAMMHPPSGRTTHLGKRVQKHALDLGQRVRPRRGNAAQTTVHVQRDL